MLESDFAPSDLHPFRLPLNNVSGNEIWTGRSEIEGTFSNFGWMVQGLGLKLMGKAENRMVNVRGNKAIGK
jgi:hypothetical protein